MLPPTPVPPPRRLPGPAVCVATLLAVAVAAWWAGTTLAGGSPTWTREGGLAFVVVDDPDGAPTPRAATSATPLGTPPAAGEGSGVHTFSLHQEDGGPPVTWDPCRPVHLVVNDRARPPGAHDLVPEAVAELARVTGLRLVVEGVTDEVPLLEDRAGFQPERYGDRWAPVLVAWSDPAEVPLLVGDVAGVGGSAAHAVDGGVLTYVSGSVVLDGPQLAELGRQPGGYPRARAIVLHELAHVLGLGHVDDPTHLMHPSSTATTSFHAGDLAGLAALGRGPCVPSL